jgi:hypothetical protein
MKNFKELINEIVTVAGTGEGLAGLGSDPPVKLRRKPDDTFAGHPVFDVDSKEAFNISKSMRNRYERWSKKLNMNNLNNVFIQKFAHRNPNSSIVVRNKNTKEMYFLKKI